MTDVPVFEPFLTLSFGQLRGSRRLALSSNAPGFTAIHWYDAVTTRELAGKLNEMADILDPRPVTALEPPPAPKKRGRPFGKKRKAKKAKAGKR